MNVRRAGSRGLLLELASNGEALAVAHALGRDLGAHLEDVVPGHRTVLVTARDLGAVEERVRAVADGAVALPERPGRLETIAVTYDGPDLAAAAAGAGMSVEEVVRRHGAGAYTVGFLGFSPGFAYLLGLDPRLHLPRLETPRTAVPAGSVAIAGPYSGIYPTTSPGGWLLLGTTAVRLFDPQREPPSLLEPGMRVRFVPA